MERPVPERAAFLAQACADDPELHGEVKSLLAQRADSFLESAPVSAINTLPPGAKLGNFGIVELIGRGGMGEVYRARAQPPQHRRGSRYRPRRRHVLDCHRAGGRGTARQRDRTWPNGEYVYFWSVWGGPGWWHPGWWRVRISDHKAEPIAIPKNFGTGDIYALDWELP